VYIPRWDMLKADSVEAISSSHQKNKQLLIEEIRKRSGVVFDAGTLLIGWARRLVEYKQPMALFSDIARLQKLASNNKNGFNMVISGPVNAEMMRSNEYIQRLVELSQNELKGRLVFLPEYDIDLSKLLVSGTDVWLNTPMVGKEACGTSGMKACLNGSLPLSTNDGWIAETNISNIGWLADDSRLGNDLLDHIEHEIAPLFYENQNEWLLRMSRSRKLITDRFGADRLLKDYEKKMYDPLLNI
jgi:starch phosphorylase